MGAGDYIGISAFGNKVYAMYTGTEVDETADDSVIASNPIGLP